MSPAALSRKPLENGLPSLVCRTHSGWLRTAVVRLSRMLPWK